MKRIVAVITADLLFSASVRAKSLREASELVNRRGIIGVKSGKINELDQKETADEQGQVNVNLVVLKSSDYGRVHQGPN